MGGWVKKRGGSITLNHPYRPLLNSPYRLLPICPTPNRQCALLDLLHDLWVTPPQSPASGSIDYRKRVLNVAIKKCSSRYSK